MTTQSFPDRELPVRVQWFLRGEWVDMGPIVFDVNDFYTDVYIDEYLGGRARDVRRLPDQEIVIAHGRADESSTTDPASVTVTLWNEDGFLTPENPDSPWWPDVKLNSLFRVRVGENTRFSGEVSEIIPSWPLGDLSTGGTPLLDEDGDPILDENGEEILGEVIDPGYAVVQVTASGILRRLGQGQKPLRSSIHRLVTNPVNLPSITDYFPMEDGGLALFSASGLPDQTRSTMTLVGLNLAADDTLPGSEALPTVPAGQDAYWQAAIRGPSGDWTVEEFVRIPKPPEGDEQRIVLFDVKATGTAARTVVDLREFASTPPSTVIRSSVYGPSGLLLETAQFTDNTIVGDDWVRIRIRQFDDGPNVVHQLTSARVTDANDSISGYTVVVAGATAGRPRIVRGAVSVAPADGVSIGHVVVHSPRAHNWLVPADRGWIGERALRRSYRLASEEGIPWTWVGRFGSFAEDALDTPEMGAQRSLPLLELLQQCSDSDNGVLRENLTALGLVMHTRMSRYNNEPAATLDAKASEIANPFVPMLDDQNKRNDVTVSQIDGTAVRKVDQASIDEIGIYDAQFDLSLADSADVRHHAGWRLHTGLRKGMRYPELAIDLAVTPDLIPEWTARRVGHLVRVEGLPPQHPRWPGDVDLFIEGWEETLSAFSWLVLANCSSAKQWQVARWYTDRYDTAGSSLSSGVTATATELPVSNVGEQWTAEADSYPFDILLGECEVVTVTDVTGSGSSQTLTVTRGVAGYNRAHAAGAAVRLARTPVLAL